MLFVFAPRKRGVCAMLGVNVWLHIIQYEHSIYISPFSRFFLRGTLGLKKAGVRVSLQRRGPSDGVARISGQLFFWVYLRGNSNKLLAQLIPGVSGLSARTHRPARPPATSAVSGLRAVHGLFTLKGFKRNMDALFFFSLPRGLFFRGQWRH